MEVSLRDHFYLTANLITLRDHPNLTANRKHSPRSGLRPGPRPNKTKKLSLRLESQQKSSQIEPIEAESSHLW